MAWAWISWSVLVLIFSCVESEKDWGTLYKDNPKQVLFELQQVENPSERLSIVQGLQQQFPGETEVLCEILDVQAQEYCIERNRRPHLWMPLKESSESASAKSNESPSGVVTTCTDVACRIREAVPFAYRGQVTVVSDICSAQSATSTHECLFATAEKIVSERGVRKYDLAVEICDLAHSFSGNCHNHLIQQLAKKAPDADSVSKWDGIFSAHRAIATTWGWRDAKMKVQLQHRLWSESLGVSYAGADRIVGNPLDIVPIEYHSHVYSAAAWRMFQLTEPTQHTLAEWVEQLMQSLQKRHQKSESIDQQRKFRAASNLWSAETAETDVVVPYLSTSQRLSSPDAGTDITIAILEAIARHPPVEISILEAGVAHDQELVRRTATRLLSLLPTDKD